jgi:hypothetical protein
MTTVDGDTVNLVVSLLLSATVTPLGGAADGRVIAKGTDWFGPTVMPDANAMVPALTTVTTADVSAILGRALA